MELLGREDAIETGELWGRELVGVALYDPLMLGLLMGGEYEEEGESRKELATTLGSIMRGEVNPPILPVLTCPLPGAGFLDEGLRPGVLVGRWAVNSSKICIRG